MLYDLLEGGKPHPMLQGAAVATATKAIGGDADSLSVFEAQEEVAEELLNLGSPALTDPAMIARAKLATAIQVSFQMGQTMEAGVMVQSESRGQRSVTYRDWGGLAAIHPTARAIAEKLNSDAGRLGIDPDQWPTVGSKRPSHPGYPISADGIIYPVVGPTDVRYES